MTGSKHLVQVSAYPADTWIYRISNTTLDLGYFFALAKDKTTFVNPELLTSFSTEKIYTSKARDEYKNKDCRHSYYSMNATLFAAGIGGLTFTDEAVTLGVFRTYYISGQRKLCNHFIPGKGIVDSAGSYMVVDSVSDTSTSMRYYKYGKVWYTLTKQLVSCAPVAGTLGRYKMVYTRSYVYNRSGPGPIPTNPDSTTTVTEYNYPQPLGQVSASMLPTGDIIKAIILNRSIPSFSGHFVPDDIIDNIYERLTIPDVNNIENLRDLKDIKKSLPPIVDLLKKRNFKSLAQFYLWYKYSYSTTKLDMKAYYEFFQKWAFDSAMKSNIKRTPLYYHTSFTDGDITGDVVTRYQIISDTYNAGVLETLGLNINLGNTWDLLPFSFVVDWFINIGDILAKIDHYEVISKLNVRSVITSTKRVVTFQPLSAFACTTLCYSNEYCRSIGRSYPLGKLEVSLKNPGTHLIDGTALIVSRKR